MFFDIIFMTQHYILYRNSNSDLGKKNKIEDDTVDKLIDSNRESEIKE